MKTEVLFFGKLTDITRCSKMEFENVGSVDELRQIVIEKFPAIASGKYSIALNNKMVITNEIITANCIVAFMPPFSGG